MASSLQFVPEDSQYSPECRSFRVLSRRCAFLRILQYLPLDSQYLPEYRSSCRWPVLSSLYLRIRSTHQNVEVPVDSAAAQVVPVVDVNAQCVLALCGQGVQVVQPQPEVVPRSAEPAFVLKPIPLQKNSNSM